MATILERTLGQVLKVLEPSLQSLELRAITVEIDSARQFVAGVLIARRTKVEEVRQQQQSFRDSACIPGSDRLHVVLDAAPIDDLQGILTALVAGNFAFNGHMFYVNDLNNRSSWPLLRDKTMSGGRNMALELEQGIFPWYTVTLESGRRPEHILKEAGLEPSDLGLIAWWELNEYLGLAFLERDNTPIRLGIALPVYAAFDRLATIRGDAAHVSLYAHLSLKSALTVRAVVRPNGSQGTYPIPSRRIPLGSPAVNGDIERFALSMPLDLTRMGSQDYVEFLLFHTDLGQLNHSPPPLAHLSQYHSMGPDILLVDALKQFVGGEHLHEYLVQSLPAKGTNPLLPFEAGVVMILSAINLHHVPLLVFREAECIRGEKQGDRSADIIAIDAELGLMVIDCTSSPPEHAKIQKLRNTAQFLGRKLQVPVRGILICASDVGIFRQDSDKFGVAFLDASQLQSVWNTAQSGNVALALNQFRMLVHHITALGEL